MKQWIWLALLACNLVQADMLDALKAYEQGNYTEAQQQFAELVPLGNELAAFNLGAMAYQGEGQEQDLSKAIAYFMLAAGLQHPLACVPGRHARPVRDRDQRTVLFAKLARQVELGQGQGQRSRSRLTLSLQLTAQVLPCRINAEPQRTNQDGKNRARDT